MLCFLPTSFMDYFMVLEILFFKKNHPVWSLFLADVLCDDCQDVIKLKLTLTKVEVKFSLKNSTPYRVVDSSSSSSLCLIFCTPNVAFFSFLLFLPNTQLYKVMKIHFGAGVKLECAVHTHCLAPLTERLSQQRGCSHCFCYCFWCGRHL